MVTPEILIQTNFPLEGLNRYILSSSDFSIRYRSVVLLIYVRLRSMQVYSNEYLKRISYDNIVCLCVKSRGSVNERLLLFIF